MTDVTGDHVKRVACWGDSNTSADWPPPVGHPRWCEYLAAQMPAGWSTVNVGAWGMVAGGFDFLYAMGWLPAVTDDTDAVVIALGTNDVHAGRTPEQIVDDLQRLVVAATRSGRAHRRRRAVYVLAVPPRTDSADLQHVTEETNALLRSRFGARLVVPDRETTLQDGVHLDDAAQHARAAAVWKVLSTQRGRGARRGPPSATRRRTRPPGSGQGAGT